MNVPVALYRHENTKGEELNRLIRPATSEYLWPDATVLTFGSVTWTIESHVVMDKAELRDETAEGNGLPTNEAWLAFYGDAFPYSLTEAIVVYRLT